MTVSIHVVAHIFNSYIIQGVKFTSMLQNMVLEFRKTND